MVRRTTIEDLGWAFCCELAAQRSSPDAEPTALTVAAALDVDERESANLMGWLMERDLVREPDQGDGVGDAYTTGPIVLTAIGDRFVDTREVPPTRVETWNGLDRLGRYL